MDLPFADALLRERGEPSRERREVFQTACEKKKRVALVVVEGNPDHPLLPSAGLTSL